MEKSKKVPAIRFKGFTDEWEERKLGDILIVKDSARVPNSLWTDKGIRYLRSSDLANPSEDGLFISTETYEMYKRQTGAPEAGDVLFASGGDIGFTYFYEGEEPIYVQGGAILYIKTSSSYQIDGKYLKIYFESNRMHRYIEEASAGGTIKHFTLMPANNAPLYYPSKAEQLKVGDFFMQLDRTISLHQRKHEQLLNIKKSMLEKMFPKDGADVPEIRFAGFTEPWERIKVKDVAPLQRGFDLPKEQMKEGDYPVVMSNGINGFHSQYKAEGPGVITGRSGTIGKVHYIEQNYWPHNTTLWVTDFKGNSPLFVYYMYQNLGLEHFQSGSGVPTLNRNDVHDTIVLIPQVNEQEKICSYLKEIDNYIDSHQQKLDQLQNIKKSCLDKMFV